MKTQKTMTTLRTVNDKCSLSSRVEKSRLKSFKFNNKIVDVEAICKLSVIDKSDGFNN